METEAEQVEQIKAWLKENGMSIVLGIVIGVGGLSGYRYWLNWQETRAAEASNHFSQMVDALDAGNGDEVDQHAQALIADFGDSDYALMARLALAKNHVAGGDFSAAEAALQQVIESAVDQPLGYIARTRLAAVQQQQQQYDAALSTLAIEFPPQFSARVDELRGDIFALQGNSDQALSAYLKAQAATPGPADEEFLQHKIDDLGGSS